MRFGGAVLICPAVQPNMRLPYPTQSPLEVAQAGRLLFSTRYRWNSDVRAITIRAINLIDSDQPMQMDMFGDWDSAGTACSRPGSSAGTAVGITARRSGIPTTRTGRSSGAATANMGKGQRCTTPTLSEDAIKALYVKAYNLLLGNREMVIEDCETLVAMLEDNTVLDAKIATTQEEIDTVIEMNKALIREHAVTGVPQEEFDQKAAAYDERFRKAEAKLNRLKAEKQDRLMRVCSVKKYVENLRGQAGPIEVWDEQAWCLLVTQVTVHADGSAEFLFRGENRMTVR